MTKYSEIESGFKKRENQQLFQC